MKTKIVGRVLALLLVLCMMLSVCPVSAVAAESGSVQKLLAILEKNGLVLEESGGDYGTAAYCPTEDSYYVALGDGSAQNGYPEKLAAELGITCKNVAEELKTVEIQLTELGKADIAAHIKKADLVTLGFGNVTCVNEAIKGVMNSGNAVDWTKFVAEEDVEQIHQIIDELVVEAVGKSNATISGALNAFAFSFVSYMYLMPDLIDAVHAIAPDALVVAVGMHNPLDGVVFEMLNIELDIGSYLSDLIAASASHISAYCAELENTLYVEAPDVATINTKTQFGLSDMMRLLKNECVEFNPSDEGHTYIKDCIMKALVISEPEQPAVPQGSVIRLAGVGRHETSLAIADAMKQAMGVDKFDTVVLAYSGDFADALAGSYLAAVKNAPIIITKESRAEQTCEYLNANLKSTSKVYVLGGEKNMPGSILTGLEVVDGDNIERISGVDRYATNIGILEAAGIEGKDLLIATGRNFADSLSASATGLPILLVNGKEDGHLTPEQKNLLKNVDGRLYVIGGSNAVPDALVKEIEEASDKRVIRVAGGDRYKTSVKIAEEFCSDVSGAVVAYASNFPDGLCGGPLAYAVGAPLILTKDGKQEAPAYTEANGITSGYVLGGTSLISDTTVMEIFG